MSPTDPTIDTPSEDPGAADPTAPEPGPTGVTESATGAAVPGGPDPADASAGAPAAPVPDQPAEPAQTGADDPNFSHAKDLLTRLNLADTHHVVQTVLDWMSEHGIRL